MTFSELTTWARAQIDATADALEQLDPTKRPHTYRWWEPGMSLPAAYLWLEPTTETRVIDTCTVRDDVRLVLCFATRPTEHEGADMLSVEQVIDTALPIIDTALRALARQPGVNARPNRAGFRVVTDRMAGQGSEGPLVVEVPVVIPWHHHTEP